ncbi:DUF5641 domain-containing protein [Trichonephila clavipes]|nr:DUF5641 domain-containing protein [Trichonephila clavipes]
MNETSSYKIPETFSLPDNALKEKRSVVTCVAKIVPLPEFIDRISSFTKLVRVCAWILIFIKNSRSPVSRTFGYLKSSELHTAVVTIVRLIQQAEFPNEFKCLFQGNPLPKDNKLLPWNLFCDSEGVLRVGGRLSRNTRLSYDQKHPMLLPKSHEFTRKLSPDPSDFTALTPAHFLVGGPIHQFPEPSQPSRSVALSERWNLIQRLRQYFWDRWSTEYLHRLQPRSKWWRTKPNLQLGDMVIVEKEKTAPLNWTLGRINKLFLDLTKRFGGHLISRFGPVNWSPRSSDLTSLDYFLWGYVKSLVYADKPQTLDHLEDNTRRVIADIRPQMLEKVIENWTSRLDYIRVSRGSHMPEIIFKM